MPLRDDVIRQYVCEARFKPNTRPTEPELRSAMEEFVGMLPPNIIIDVGESKDDESVVLTFDPPRALPFSRVLKSSFFTAQQHLLDDVKSVIVDELGYRRVPRRHASTFVRAGIKAVVLNHTHSLDQRRDAADERGIPSCSVEFYGE